MARSVWQATFRQLNILREPSPLEEMKHRREWRAGGFCLRLSHRSGAETGDPEMWRRLLGSKAVGGSFSPQLRPRLATSSLYNFREQNNFFHTQWEFTPSPSSSFYIFISPPCTLYSSHLQTAVGASRTVQQTAAWPHKDRHRVKSTPPPHLTRHRIIVLTLPCITCS